MAIYIHGWIECKKYVAGEPDKPFWETVQPLPDLLDVIKDNEGFASIFGEMTSFGSVRVFGSIAMFRYIALNAKSHNFVTYSPSEFAPPDTPFSPLTQRRGLPKDVSASVQAEYAQFDSDPKETMPACDVITCTDTEWLGWRETKLVDWEKIVKHADTEWMHWQEIQLADWERVVMDSESDLFPYYRNEQGEYVFRSFLWSLFRPLASWITWQELKLVDWEEEMEWIDPFVQVYQCDEQGELGLPETSFFVQREFERKVGRESLDLSREQEWTVGDRVFRTEKVKRKRKETVTNWTQVFRVLEELAEMYGDEGVRVIAWLH